MQNQWFAELLVRSMCVFHQINKDTMVEVWKNWLDYQAEVANVTEQGYKTIIAAPWYLDQISRGQDWIKYYSYEPLNFTGKFCAKLDWLVRRHLAASYCFYFFYTVLLG